jgi:hypothetical protein
MCEPLDADDDKDLKVTYGRADGTAERMVATKPCDDDTGEGDFLCPHLVTPLAPPAPTLRSPKPDFLASREGSSSEVHSQEHRDHPPTNQLYGNHTEYTPPPRFRTVCRPMYGFDERAMQKNPRVNVKVVGLNAM